MKHNHPRHGFTLVEMSIVLLIIGLIIGGVVLGKDLMEGAAACAVISQIASYDSAVSAFRAKYDGLPGDLPPTLATGAGFTSRLGTPGYGNGDEYLGSTSGATTYASYTIFDVLAMSTTAIAEPKLFWVDLAKAGMIAGKFFPGTVCVSWSPTVATDPANCVPTAKIGQGSFIYAWGYQGLNYYGLSNISSNYNDEYNTQGLAPTLTVAQAFSIDSKVDDGLPQSGSITAFQPGYETMAGDDAYFTLWSGGDTGPADKLTATPPGPLSCYDDQGVTGSVRQYSMQVNNGAHVNCALAFQFECHGGC